MFILDIPYCFGITARIKFNLKKKTNSTKAIQGVRVASIELNATIIQKGETTTFNENLANDETRMNINLPQKTFAKKN